MKRLLIAGFATLAIICGLALYKTTSPSAQVPITFNRAGLISAAQNAQVTPQWLGTYLGGFAAIATLNDDTNNFNSPVTFTTNVYYAAFPPVPSACGTSPAVDANSSNKGGKFTLGTTTTTCTLTFQKAYATISYCLVTPASNFTGTYYISSEDNTQFTVTTSVDASGDAFNYVCTGN